MSKLPFRMLLAAVFGLGLMMVPTYSEALPRHCDLVCSCSGSCNWKCNAVEYGVAITTCGAWGICNGQCRTTPKSAFEQAVQATEHENETDSTACAGNQSKLSEGEAAPSAAVFLGE